MLFDAKMLFDVICCGFCSFNLDIRRDSISCLQVHQCWPVQTILAAGKTLKLTIAKPGCIPDGLPLP